MHAIYDDEFSDLTFEEKKDLFLTLSSTLKDEEAEDNVQLLDLVGSMVSDLVDEDQCDQYYDYFWEELDLELSLDEIPDELLGINPEEQAVPEEWKKQFHELFMLSNKNTKKAKKDLELFNKLTGGIPGVHLIELLRLQKENNAEYGKRLQQYALLYPDYALMQLLKASWQVIDKQELPDIPGYPYLKEKFFAYRNSIHGLEFSLLLTTYSFAVGIEHDINKIEAFMDVVYDLDLPEAMEEMMLANNTMQKISYLMNYTKKSRQ